MEFFRALVQRDAPTAVSVINKLIDEMIETILRGGDLREGK